MNNVNMFHNSPRIWTNILLCRVSEFSVTRYRYYSKTEHTKYTQQVLMMNNTNDLPKLWSHDWTIWLVLKKKKLLKYFICSCDINVLYSVKLFSVMRLRAGLPCLFPRHGHHHLCHHHVLLWKGSSCDDDDNAAIIIVFFQNVEGSTFESIPASFWYTIVTMTTLGWAQRFQIFLITTIFTIARLEWSLESTAIQFIRQI